MNRIITILLSCLSLISIVNGQDNEPAKLLNAAIYQEEVDGNLEEAIRLYEEIVTNYPEYRSVVAEALYRNGLTNEKLGNLKARQYYEKVVNNYSDQPEMAQLAQKRLSRILRTGEPIDASDPEELSVKKIYSNPNFYGSSSYGGEFISTVKWGRCDLYYLNIKEGEKHYITNNGSWSEPIACADNSTWSPDNKKIAYGFSDSTGTHIFIYAVASNTSVKITSAFPDKYIGPIEWTMDGSHLLISRGDMDSSTYQLLSVQNAETIDLFKVSNEHVSDAGEPTVSPGMKYILYTRKTDGKRKIYVMFLETGERKAVVNDDYDNWGMKWEKEGESFIFASDRSGSPALYRLKIQEGIPIGEPKLIYENINKQYKPLSLSDDGILVFTSSTFLAQNVIADIDFQSGNFDNHKQISTGKRKLTGYQVWSQDGNKIASVSNYPISRLYIYDYESGNVDSIDLDFPVFDQGWNQWSGNDEEFMVSPRNVDYEEIAIINLSTRKVKRIKGVGRFAVFQGENNVIYTDDSQRHIILRNRITGEVKTLCSVENDDQYFFLKTSPDQKQVAFFEGNTKNTYWRELNKLWLLTIETGQKELIWECNENEYFGWGVIDWMVDSEHIFVFFGHDKTISVSEQNEFNPYLVNINTREKRKFGKVLSNLTNDQRGAFRPTGNKIIYSSNKRIKNVWLMENIGKKQVTNW